MSENQATSAQAQRRAGDMSATATASGVSKDNGNDGVGGGAGASGASQQDWSILWSCFDNPLTLLATTESLPKGMQVIQS